MIRFAVLASAALLLSGANVATTPPDVATIMKRSVAAHQRDWAAGPRYDYLETDQDHDATRTYDVTMMLGSPYQRLVKLNGMPLSNPDEKAEQIKFDRELARRRSESSDQRAARMRSYRAERERDRDMLSQIASAFDFALAGQATMDGYETYYVRATPRAGYRPPTAYAQALTGMQCELWIDTQTYNWVKASARVVRPVSIAGFLARVDPGTSFELEEMPVDKGIWMPKHFAAQTRTRILLFNHNTRDDETYFGYRNVSTRTASED